MTRLFLNIGHNVRVRPQDFVGAIANEANIPGRSIGAIDIHESFSFVDVPTGDAERVMNVMNSSSIKGKSVNVEIAQESSGSGGGDTRRGPRPERAPREGGFGRGGAARGGFGRGPRNDSGGRQRRDRW